ncbi:MAG: hypothetical protein WBP45_12850 [Daejeonella sp.]
MKKPFYFLLLIIFCSSCYTSGPVIKKYKPAMLYIGLLNYMPKPTSFDSITVSNYISGGILQATESNPGSSLGFDNDYLELAQLAFSRGHRFKNLNFAYGLDAFAGKYYNSSLDFSNPDHFDDKSISGFQVKTAVNTYQSATLYELRIIGLDLSYSKEFGDFSQFRKDVIGKENFYSIPTTGLFTAGLSSEVIFRGRRSARTQYGFSLNLKNTFGNLKYQGFDYLGEREGKAKSLRTSISLYLQLKRYFFILEGSKSGRLNAGYRF